MEIFLQIFEALSRLLFVFALGWFMITNLQYFHYRFDRFIFHHTKPMWLIAYIVLPITLFYLAGNFYWIIFYFIFLPTLLLWHKKLDKKLVVTARVKRFFALLMGFAVVLELFYFIGDHDGGKGVLIPLIFALAASHLLENSLRGYYKNKAKNRLLKRDDLIVIALTASYGKTSIKHFLYELLRKDFNVYATPGNVNTDLGIAADINNSLPQDAKIYIVEAGARQKSDILDIVLLTNPHYAILGKVGAQHIEYFKTIENIQSTKREILVSPRMISAVVHESAGVKPNESVQILHDSQITNVHADLNGTEWDLTLENGTIHFKTAVLGSFNALNISLAFLMASALGVDQEKLLRTIETLQNFNHRLQPIRTLHKLIIDDSYNGNLEGMFAAFELAKTYNGRKVVVTPGLVESDEASNIALAHKINEIFDLCLITGTLNADLLAAHIDHPKRKRVFDKRGLETILAKETRTGDLILFANDAPSFV